MKNLVKLIFLVLSLIIFKEILAQGMTLKKQGAGSLPNNTVLTNEEFSPFTPSFPNNLNTNFSTDLDLVNSVSYSASGVCSLSGNSLTTLSSVGICTITAKIGNLTKTKNINVKRPQNLIVTASPSSIYTSGISTLSSSGNQGAVTYSVTSGSCTVSGSTVTAGSSSSTCTIIATAAATNEYFPGTATTSIIVNTLQPQNITVTASPSSIYTLGTSTLSTSGNQGAVTYSVTSGSCTISGSIVTAGTSADTCTITANAAAVTGYSAGSATTTIIVNALADQNLVVTSDKSSLKIQRSGTCNTGEKANLTTTGIMCTSPSVTYSTSTPTICSVSGNSVTILSSTGSCSITASQPACSGYKAGTASLNIPAGGYVSSSISISVSPLTGNATNKANATVTVTNGIPPYSIACSSSDYRANCNMTSNDGTNTITVGAGTGTGAKNSPKIYGGTGNTFNVQAWAMYTRAVVGATGFSGNATFKVYDSGCYNGTPFGATTQVYAPN